MCVRGEGGRREGGGERDDTMRTRFRVTGSEPPSMRWVGSYFSIRYLFPRQSITTLPTTHPSGINKTYSVIAPDSFIVSPPSLITGALARVFPESEPNEEGALLFSRG